MRFLVIKMGFIIAWLGILALGTFAISLPESQAAPLAALTGTPTEQATKTPTSIPTNTPNISVPSLTATPHHDKPGIADPLVTKSVNVTEARIGDEVTFTVKVTNRGNDTANDVVVTDPIPDYMDVIEATTTRGNVSSNGRTIIVNVGQVAASEEVTIRIRVRVNERAQPPVGRNGVSITTSSPGDDPGNNSSEVTFSILGDPTPTPMVAVSPITSTPVIVPPTPLPKPPQKLPRTAGEDLGVQMGMLLLAGIFAIGGSVVLRSRGRRA